LKVNVEIDCTPAEARAFLGLPDVTTLNAHVVEEMTKRLDANIGMAAPEELVKSWMAFGGQASEQFLKMMSAAAGGKAGVSSRCRRKSASKRSATSGFSARNARAVSLPCPMRSPPKVYQDPLFSTSSCATPRSNRSPSREIPAPYKMSTSASRKGAATLFFTTLILVRFPTTFSPSLIAAVRRTSTRTEE